MKFHDRSTSFRLSPPGVKLALGGAVMALISVLSMILTKIFVDHTFLVPIIQLSFFNGLACAMISFMAFGFAFLMLYCESFDAWRISWQVRKNLYHPAYGNPLGLKEGERLPPVCCVRKKRHPDVFVLQIKVCTRDIDKICALSSRISSALQKKYQSYAVTGVNTDVAGNAVYFFLENVKIDYSITAHSSKELYSGDPKMLIVQYGTYIDLSQTGSILVAGKTRSGKTTGVISLLLQVLMAGRDNYGSEVIIVDPKQAELSRLPHVVTVDEDGEVTKILGALSHFFEVIHYRQNELDKLSEEKSGEAVMWYDAGMHPSFLFLDEYVALRAMLPAKAAKGSDYCLATFDDNIKKIVTTGASAGCFVIISIAEASVAEGGLPSMLRSAMSTKILFRPTKQEGRLIWDSKELDVLLDRVYGPGDAWFSSADGIHEKLSCVHFPRLEFGEYGELGRLLQAYYGT